MNKDREQLTAWLTKYALTSGIEKRDGCVLHDISSAMFSYNRYDSAHGKDWHRTEAAALARAEEMRVKKIASLRKSIKAFEALKFEAES